MPAHEDEDGENYADELDYKVWNAILGMNIGISLDEAVGKTIVTTEVSPYDGHVTIYVRDNER